jgi:hypothetical protein
MSRDSKGWILSRILLYFSVWILQEREERRVTGIERGTYQMTEGRQVVLTS